MKTRLQHFLQAENLTPSQFADRIGIQRSGVSHVLAGRNKPGFDFMESMLLSYPSLNAEWLMTGKGKMYKELKQSLPQETEDIQDQDQEQQVTQKPVQSEMLFQNAEQLMDSGAETYSKPPEEERKVVKVLFFYSDNTFSEFTP